MHQQDQDVHRLLFCKNLNNGRTGDKSQEDINTKRLKVSKSVQREMNVKFKLIYRPRLHSLAPHTGTMYLLLRFTSTGSRSGFNRTC